MDRYSKKFQKKEKKIQDRLHEIEWSLIGLEAQAGAIERIYVPNKEETMSNIKIRTKSLHEEQENLMRKLYKLWNDAGVPNPNPGVEGWEFD